MSYELAIVDWFSGMSLKPIHLTLNKFPTELNRKLFQSSVNGL